MGVANICVSVTQKQYLQLFNQISDLEITKKGASQLKINKLPTIIRKYNIMSKLFGCLKEKEMLVRFI